MSRLARNAAVFSALTLASRVSGLVRMSVTAAVLALGPVADAYFAANVVPNILYEFIAGGLLSAFFIPALARAQKEHGPRSAEAARVANTLLGGVGAVLAAVSVVAVAGAPVIAGALTAFARRGPEGDAYGAVVAAGADRELVAYFIRFFAPQMFFYGLNAVFMAILNARDVFAITAAAPIVNNVLATVTLALYGAGAIGPAGLAIGTTAGVAAMALVQVPWLARAGFAMRPRLDFRDPVFTSVAVMAGPVAVVAVANLFGTGFRAALLNSLPGGFATFTYCFGLIMVPYGILAVSIATVLYPAMARAHAAGDRAGFARAVGQGIRNTLFVTAPIAVLMALLAEPIVSVAFQRGAFGPVETAATAAFLRIYALSIVPYSLVVFATRVFYAREDTRTPAAINIAGVVLASVLNAVLIGPMGAPGVAAAAVVTYTLTTAASVWAMRSFLDDGEVRKSMAASAWKTIAATVVLAVAVAGAGRFAQPAVRVLDAGPRFPAPLARRSGRAEMVVTTSSQSLARLWTALGRPSPPPEVDFRRASVLVAFGPRSHTTTTLTLLGRKTAKGAGGDDGSPAGAGVFDFRVEIDAADTTAVRRLAEAAAATGDDSPTSPSYLIATVTPAVAGGGEAGRVQAEFVFRYRNRGPVARLARIVAAPALPRLVWLSAVGAAVFAATAVLLGSAEFRGLVGTVRRRAKL